MTINVIKPAITENNITNIMVAPRALLKEHRMKLYTLTANIFWTSPEILALNKDTLVKVTTSSLLVQQKKGEPWKVLTFSNDPTRQMFSDKPTDVNLMDYIKSNIIDGEVSFNLERTIHQIAFDNVLHKVKLDAPELSDSEVLVASLAAPAVISVDGTVLVFTLKHPTTSELSYHNAYTGSSECIGSDPTTGDDVWVNVEQVKVGNTIRKFTEEDHQDYIVMDVVKDPLIGESINVNLIFNIHPEVIVNPIEDGVVGQWSTVSELATSSQQSTVDVNTTLSLLHLIDNDHHLSRLSKGNQ